MLMGQQGDTRYAEGNLMCFYCPKKHTLQRYHKHRVIIPEENVFAWEKKHFVATVSIRDIKVAKSKTSAVLLVNNRRLIRRKFNES